MTETIEIHPFRLEEWDWEVLLELANQAVPFAPEGNREWLAYRKAFDESKRLRRHYMARDREKPLGYGCIEQQREDPQWLRIYVVCSPENLQDQVGQRLYDTLLQDANELGIAHLWAQEYQKDAPIREFLTSRGFVEVNRFTLPDQLPMVVYVLDLDIDLE
jgi:N-acetylglutamate synthase-like GNAT family acetyltransferase